MPTVANILKKRSKEVAVTREGASVVEAAKQMNDRRIGSLVVASGHKVVGIFTERDILCRVVAEQRDAATTTVKEVMTTPVACCHSATKVAEVRSVMSEKRIRHMPVVDDGRLVGMISSGDIMATEHRQQQETIEYLHEYFIDGTR